MKCPNCGAEIGSNQKCEFCGTHISLEMKKEQDQLNKQGCPKCGSTNIQFKRERQGEIKKKKSKQVVYRTVGFCKDCGHTWYPSSNNATQNNNLVWWVLGWIFIFPVPVMVLIWRKKNTWDIKVKIGVTIVFWLLFIILGACGDRSDTSSEAETEANAIQTNNIDREKNDEESGNMTIEQTSSTEENPLSAYGLIDKCYDELITHNTAKDWNELDRQIRDLAKKYDLYQDSRNTGLGAHYAKIASTREEAKVISNDDVNKGKYYIRIDADFSNGRPDIQLIDNINLKRSNDNVEISGAEEMTSSTNEIEPRDKQQVSDSTDAGNTTIDEDSENTEVDDVDLSVNIDDSNAETGTTISDMESSDVGELQEHYYAISALEDRDAVNNYVKENGLKVNWFGGYHYNASSCYVGLTAASVSSRSRDREGPVIVIDFASDGRIEKSYMEQG